MSSDRPPPGSRRPIAEYLPITIDRNVWCKKLSESKKKKKSHLSAELLTRSTNQQQIQLKKREREQVFLFYAVMHKRDFYFSFFCLTRHTMVTQTLLFRLAPCLRLTRGEPGVVEPPGHSQASAGWQSQRKRKKKTL